MYIYIYIYIYIYLHPHMQVKQEGLATMLQSTLLINLYICIQMYKYMGIYVSI
jgi:hypothetical protein